MALVCPKQDDSFDARTAELHLVRDVKGSEVEVFAYLSHEGVQDSKDVETDRICVPLGHPLDQAVVLINQDSGLLQLLHEKLLDTFPVPCACPSRSHCYSLGTKKELREAILEVGGK